MSKIEVKYKQIKDSPKLPILKKLNYFDRFKSLAVKVTKHFIKGLFFIQSILKNKRFQIIVGLVLLVLLSFFAGIKVSPYLDKLNIGQDNIRQRQSTLRNRNNSDNSPVQNIPGQTVNNTNTNSTNVTFNGEILSIDQNQIEIKDKDAVIKKFNITPKTIFTSPEGKAIKSSELKVGYSIMIFATKGSDETLSLVRVKILKTK